MAEDATSEAASSLAPEAGGEDLHLDYDPDSPFQCCICLDLIYKPVVLSCGHISCFWCVHRAMRSSRASHCAICRQPYRHFPSICLLLHYLIFKLEPIAYNRREREVLEEEKRLGTHSPQLLEDVVPVEKSLECGTSNQVSIHSFFCTFCKEMLYKPSVLNCGHVYCGPCLVYSVEPLSCQDCQRIHSGEFPNVCLDLDSYLQKQFPKEYESRREHVLIHEVKNHCGTTSSSGVLNLKNLYDNSKAERIASRLKDDHLLTKEIILNLHVGIGCDSCGMYPIIGKRYKCKDCKEKIGFDLCGACYNSTSKLPGRFNQQHTPDHKFELDDSKILARFINYDNSLRQNLSAEPIGSPEGQENLDSASEGN